MKKQLESSADIKDVLREQCAKISLALKDCKHEIKVALLLKQ